LRKTKIKKKNALKPSNKAGFNINLETSSITDFEGILKFNEVSKIF
jgi:hypothetical protein